MYAAALFLSFHSPVLLQEPVAKPAAKQDAGDAPVWKQADLEHVSDDIRKQIEELRGRKYTEPVAVKLTNKEGLGAYIQAREAKTVTSARKSRDETIAKLLGLLPPDFDMEKEVMKLLESQVGGFYDPTSKCFYLMDQFTGPIANVILAHELTHALDDQYYDIDASLKKCGEVTDAELALQAVVEGSGTNAMNVWTKKNITKIPKAELEKVQGMGADVLKDCSPYLWKPLLAAYLRGEAFLVRSSGMNLFMKAAPIEDIDRAFKTPPRSTEQILHPEKYWDEKKRDDPMQVQIDTSKRPAGWNVLGEDTLGELYLALVSTPRAERKGIDVGNAMNVMGVKYTNVAAEGWGGDRAVLFGRGADRTLLLMTVWDSAEDADQFAASIGADGALVIPSFTGAHEAAAGWHDSTTPTAVHVTRGSTPKNWVAVSVNSFADPKAAADAPTWDKITWKIAD